MISRYAPLFFGLIVGIALGLVYGWVIRPAEFSQSSPDALREDYRIDITLMIAEAYAHDNNRQRARDRLTLLDSQNPEGQLQTAWRYAQEHQFDPEQIATLAGLATELGVELTPWSSEQP